MQTLSIELPAREDQTRFNLRRWQELLADDDTGRSLARVAGRIETDRHGHIIMYPPAGFAHGSFQSEIAHLLRTMLPHGRTVTECPISTFDGVKAADVAWLSPGRLAEVGKATCLPIAPEICVEVLSPGNTAAEMREKKALYFAAGAQEVWFCDRAGRMTFHGTADSAGEAISVLCADFPVRVEV